MTASRVKSTVNILIIALFFAFTLSSVVAFLLKEKKIWSEAENRNLAPPPALPVHQSQLPQFFTGVEEYINDHFGFRDFYLSRYHRELDKRFGITSPRSTVIKGLEGWYYFNNFNLLNDFLGRISLNRQQLKAWLTSQEEKHDWLRKRGIHFLYFVAPNKQSIYPEYLMQHALASKGTSRFEQLLKVTDGQLPDFMVNLHPLLTANAHDRQLYYKTDSHWNKLAAYMVFEEVLNRISSWFPHEHFTTEFAFTADATGPGGDHGRGGDLVRMLMQSDITETYPVVEKFHRCGQYKAIPRYLTGIPRNKGRRSFVKECAEKNLTAVVFRDSFFNQLEPFFSENFSKVIYLWKDYDQQNLEEILVEFKPDIVIEEVVERHMFDIFLEKEKQRQFQSTGTSDSP